MDNKEYNTLETRDTFNTKLGFILACVGSAVGMGNIWLFPYRVGQFGGAAFLIPYFIFVILIGFTGVIGEMAFGRAMGTGPLGAFKKAMERRGKKTWRFNRTYTSYWFIRHSHRIFCSGRLDIKIYSWCHNRRTYKCT